MSNIFSENFFLSLYVKKVIRIKNFISIFSVPVNILGEETVEGQSSRLLTSACNFFADSSRTIGPQNLITDYTKETANKNHESVETSVESSYQLSITDESDQTKTNSNNLQSLDENSHGSESYVYKYKLQELTVDFNNFICYYFSFFRVKKSSQSVVWNHAVKNKIKKTVTCKYCQKTFNYCGNTTNILKHLKSQHKIFFSEEKKPAAEKRKLENDASEEISRKKHCTATTVSY